MHFDAKSLSCTCIFFFLPALIKGVNLDSGVSVLLQNLLCVFICVERVHENQWYVCVVSLV